MWRNCVSTLLIAYTVYGTFDDTRIKCPISKDTQRLNPPKLRGVWTSSRCETRPGPEFILRKYTFRRKKFKLYQYYYFDNQCRRPKYGIVAEGSIKLLQSSWIVKGGSEANYRLNNVTITPYNRHFARKLNKKIKMYCKSLHGINVKRYKPYKIFNFPKYNKGHYKTFNDFDCTELLYLSFHELQLIKMEKEKTRKNLNLYKSYLYSNQILTKKKPTKFLYLGDIHTDMKQRRLYRPTSYQTPLTKGNLRYCDVCRKVKKATISKPPRLYNKGQQRRFVIDGYWKSTICETRAYGQFVQRMLVFHANGVSWEGEYNFYKDPDCLHGTLSVFVSGDFLKEKESRIIGGSSDYRFNVTEMSVTPKDFYTTKTLNYSTHCGPQGSWKLDFKQSVLNTNGCRVLGLHVPTTEYEIIKLESREHDDVLLVGERPTDGKSLSGPNIRPTSFQPPLKRCMIERINNELPDLD